MLKALLHTFFPERGQRGSDPSGTDTLTLQLGGLHCTSCALVIDESLEELDGIYSSKTNYAQSLVTVKYDVRKMRPKAIQKKILSLGYSIKHVR